MVTGASSGIGCCLCELLVDQGATVIATARREDRLLELKNRLGTSLVVVPGDVTDPKVRQRISQTASSARDGKVDLLVNNAGVGAIGPFVQATPERLRRLMEVNFFAPVELTRLLLPAIRQGRAPVICNIGSVLGHRAVPNKSEYCASKFAIHGWSDALRAELAGEGVQVTLISPSTTKSEFFDSLVDSGSTKPTRSLPGQSPERVARTILAAIRRRRSEVICSTAGRLLVYGDRLSPPLMNFIVSKFA